MDDFTFGNDLAAINLAKILKETNSKHLTRSVSNLIHRFDVLINAVKNLESKKTKSSFYIILKKELEYRTGNSPFNHTKAYSHAKTHIITKLKKSLRGI